MNWTIKEQNIAVKLYTARLKLVEKVGSAFVALQDGEVRMERKDRLRNHSSFRPDLNFIKNLWCILKIKSRKSKILFLTIHHIQCYGTN